MPSIAHAASFPLASPVAAPPTILLVVGVALAILGIFLALAIARELGQSRKRAPAAPPPPRAPSAPPAPPPAPLATTPPLVVAPPVEPPTAPPAPPAPTAPTVLPAPGMLFIGREQELDDLVARLRRAHGPAAIAVIGPPGAGKHSTVARAIEPHRADDTFRDGYSWHVCSEYHGDVGLRRLLIDVLDRFGGPAVAMTTTLRMGESAVMDLVRGQRILFWLDDVPADFPLGRAITTLTARDTTGAGPTVLLTSRDDWAMPEVNEIALDPPQLDEALDLLRAWLELAGRPTASADYDALKAICVNLSFSPLALRLAAGYATLRGTPFPKLAAELGGAVYPPGDPTQAAERLLAYVEGELFPQTRQIFAVLGVLERPTADLDMVTAIAAAVTSATSAAIQSDIELLGLVGLIEPDGDEGRPGLRLHPLARHLALARFTALSPALAGRARAALASVARARRSATLEDEMSALTGT